MDMIKFFETVMNLKNEKRAGWVERGVRGPETSSDHSFMVVLMVLVLGKNRKLNMEKALKLAIVHDLPEAIVGDIISKGNWKEGGHMWDREKVRLEREAMKKLSSLLGDAGILDLWEEFESLKSQEARFVKDLDRLATILQAIEYQKTGNHKKPMEPFWDEKGISSIKDPELRKLLDLFLKSLDRKKV
ncbi:MAG: HD domain-containing protein [Candidatus Aenigmarchaeota archaeon]|nr:HD domain-containing protein [Candidatus Aenigmarchaeota archaeon]